VTTSLRILAGNGLLRVLNQFGNIRVLFEAVPDAIIVQIKTGVAKFRQDCGCRDIVQVGTDTGCKQFVLRNAGRQRLIAARTLTSQPAK